MKDRLKSWWRDLVWPHRWVWVLNLYLLSPLVVGPLVLPSNDMPKKLMLFTAAASVLWLTALQATVRKQWLAHLLMAPFYLVVATDLFVITRYNTRLSASLLSVIFENLADAKEYLAEHGRPVGLTLLSVTAFYGVGFSQVRGLHLKPPRWLVLGAWLGLLASYGVVLLWVKDLPHVASADRSTPFGVLPQSYLAYSVYQDIQGQAERTRDFKFGATRPNPPPENEPETYVLVIGESSRADHWQVLGYPRATNPRLSLEPNLVSFTNVVSQAAFTKASVPFIITRGNALKPEVVSKERSIVTAYAEAGFHTAWLSTQTRDPFTGAINRFSSEAKDQRFVERQHDEVLLGMLRESLATEPGANRRFVLVHSMGSHFTCTNRYPRSFNVFPDDAPGASAQEVLINSYDNTVVYTDNLLAELIATLKARGGRSALLYVSDHGENLNDDERKLFGHFFNNEFDLPVPMLFWASDSWKATHAEAFEAAQKSSAAPLSTTTVFPTLLDLAGLVVPGTDTASTSVLSAQRQPAPRMVFTDPGSFDFDQQLGAAMAKKKAATGH